MSRTPAQLALGRLAAALFLSGPALAQGPKWVHRQGGEAHGVHFATSSVGAIAEDGGRIRYWDDLNQVWTQAETDQASRDDLKGIFFLDENLGWSVGFGGTVLHTTDSGRNWTRIATILDYTDAPKPAELWDVLMTSDQTGWIVGSDGVIAQTSNNWLTWSVPTQLQGVIAGFGGTDPEDPYDIKILFDGTIVVAADWGATYRRDPGTQQWSRIPIAVGGPCDTSQGSYLELWNLGFIPGTDDGWCVGGNNTNGGQLYQTLDGGATWTRYTQVDALASGANPGVLCGQQQPGPTGCGLPTLYGGAVIPAANGQPATFLAGGYARSIFRWYPSGSASRMVFDICTQSCTEFTSTGPYWVQEQATVGTGISPSLPPLSALHSLKTTINGQDLVEVWSVGRLGTIRYSSNSGSSWQDQGTVQPSRFLAGDFLNATTGVTIGQGRIIQRTTNGGVTLAPVYPSTQVDEVNLGLNGRDIALSSGGLGIAVGERYWCDQSNQPVLGQDWVAFSTDSGATWTPAATLPPGTSVELLTCGFIPGTSTAFVAGGVPTGPYIATITHSGGSWGAWTVLPIRAGTSQRVRSAAFLQVGSDIHGVAVGTRFDSNDPGLAMYTVNGGANWIPIQVNSAANGADFLGVAVISTLDDMRVTTSNGKILKRDTNGVLVPESLSIPSGIALRGITYRAGTWVACGDNGTVLMNTGSGWTTPKSQNSETLYSVCFDAADHGFVIGQQALLAEYTD